eukprot:superscaffoldBa00000782_g7201
MEFHENTPASELTDEMDVQEQTTSKSSEDIAFPPKKHEKETQTLDVWQEMEDANKILQQEKKAWEAEKKALYQEFITLTRDKEALQEEMDRTIKVVKMQFKALDEEREILYKENVILKKQRHAEEDEKEAMQVNEALQGEIQEVQVLFQNEKQQSDINEARARVHTMEDTLRDQLEEMEAIHGFDEVILEQQKQELEALYEKVRELEELLQWERDLTMEQEEQDLRSGPDRLSLWRRILRIFIPGWRRRYESAETVRIDDLEEQARLESQRRLSTQRFVTFCRSLLRRRRDVEGESGSWGRDVGAAGQSQRNE